jgi:hypothetical protein
MFKFKGLEHQIFEVFEIKNWHNLGNCNGIYLPVSMRQPSSHKAFTTKE